MFSSHFVVFLELENIENMERMVIWFDVEVVFTFIDVPIHSGRTIIGDFNAKTLHYCLVSDI